MAQASKQAKQVKKAQVKQVAFTWEGVDKSGNKKQGELRGASVAHIKAELRKQGINPTKVKKKPTPLFGSAQNAGKKITTKDIAILSRQLATMMQSGVPLVQSFEIIGRGHDNPAMRTLVLTIKADVEGGNSLADSLRKHPKYFDDLYCNLVRAGEAAGILDSLLTKLAIYKEKIESIKGKIKKAMFYPTAVVIAAFIITSILLLFVVPQFQDLFKGFGADLPALTQLVIELSAFFQAQWYIIFGGVGAGVYTFVQCKSRSKGFRNGLERMSLVMPVMGEIVRKATIARFARTLSTMFAAGVPLVEALTTVSGAAGNVVYGNAILQMRDDVSTGTALQVSMRNTNLFPNMVVQLIAIGEEAGTLDQMLAKVADFYEEEVDNAVDGLSSLLEPIIMAFLGVIVGGLVVAMYLPIFKMGTVV